MATTIVSRRDFLAAGAMALAAGAAPPLAAQTTALQDLALVNGRIHTMDRSRRVVSQLLIRNGRFVAVGDRVPRSGARVIDLKGRTVIPGLIDAHDHIVLVGNRPGW